MTPRQIRAAMISAILSLGLFSPAQAVAQPPSADKKPAPKDVCWSNPSTDIVHTFYLRNMTQVNDANELYTALRNMLPPEAKSFFVPSQMAIEVCGPPEQIAFAQKLVNDLDRPRKSYRLTYTVSELDGAKRISAQHFSMIVSPGQESTVKQGSRVPLVTGSYGAATSSQQTQVTYIDVGMNFAATLDETAEGIRLRSVVEQSSIAEERSGVGPQDPVVRQASFKGSSYLAPGKPLRLGSFDIPDSTRHLELEVMMEPL
jgi:hypothetical protein